MTPLPPRPRTAHHQRRRGHPAPRVHEVLVAASEVPEASDWLTDAELARLMAYRVPGRRADWRIGRWAAKRAVALALSAAGREVGPDMVEVLPADDGAPEPRIVAADEFIAMAVSISHSGGNGLAAARLGGGELGVDLETIEPRSERFIDDYFTPAEAARVRAAAPGERPLFANLTWAAKEAALKALRTGLRLDTRAVVVEEIGADDFIVQVPGGARWHGAWSEAAGQVRTLVWGPEIGRVACADPGAPRPPGPPTDRENGTA